MSGGKPWGTRGTLGSGETLAINNRPDVQTLDVSQTGSVASGSTEKVEVYAPTGSVYEFRNVKFQVNADANATSGDHQIQVRPVNQMAALRGKSNYNTKVQADGGGWRTADLIDWPQTEAGFMATINNLRATDSKALTLTYVNNTDAAQDNERTYQLYYGEVSY